MSYTSAQIIAALKSSNRQWQFEYQIYDVTGLYLFSADVSSCTVKNDDTADVKRTITLSMREAHAAQINFATNRIMPLVKLKMPDGGSQVWSMGYFLMTNPTQQRLGLTQIPRAITGYDLGLVLSQDKLVEAYSVGAGTYYLDGVRAVLLSANLPSTLLASSLATLPAAREWDPGTAKTGVVSDLLTAINYNPLTFDGSGNPTTNPYQDPNITAPTWAYVNGSDGVIIPDDGVNETLDLTDVPNVWVRYVSSPDANSDGEGISLRSEYINSNPASPTSTATLDRSIVDYAVVSDIADQPTLDAYTQSVAQQASQVYSVVTFSSGMIPLHTSMDVITLDWGQGPLKYKETGWSLELKAGGKMTHTVQRVVTV